MTQALRQSTIGIVQENVNNVKERRQPMENGKDRLSIRHKGSQVAKSVMTEYI